MTPAHVLTALLLAASTSLAAAPSFREQVDTYARSLSLTVDWVSDAQLDEDPKLEHLARLCTPPGREGTDVVYMLEQEPGVLWAVHQDVESSEKCPSTSPRSSRPTSLTFDLDEGRAWSSESLAFREGKPVTILRSEGSASSFYGDAEGPSVSKTEEDWDRLISHNVWRGTHSKGKEVESVSQSALVPVLASRKSADKLPPTFNQVVHGASHWTGEKDAAVRVAALAQGTDQVRLRIQVVDDVNVSATSEMSNRNLLGTDHLEIWWALTDPSGDVTKARTRQLAVARTAKGVPLARWLLPEGFGEPLPRVSLEGDTFIVDLPLSSLGVKQPEQYWETPFTVVFSDSDAPDAGQQTLVATSPLRWNEASTLGRLISFEGHSRYPQGQGDRWMGSVSIPTPTRLELTDAGVPVPPSRERPAP
ncbi:hypothetical protein [Vitiosangium sp. GDMCC 1.1324]|uniref:hypothetical protein n=1 Tax=Vitiosangium sp. (strain GDMCC 1.1324) TaxID=2138576 RepID=UPI000D3D5F39|nr:hypothetical protein [Vitiosangium sp. GDMCC 1.1324]PTL75513.1 hypothetical protein DAT35_54635 [Vitiosangium sp. GDMCC 1.1324]